MWETATTQRTPEDYKRSDSILADTYSRHKAAAAGNSMIKLFTKQKISFTSSSAVTLDN